MGFSLLQALHREGFEELLALHDRRSGLLAYLAIHDSSAGPAFGGIRRHTYDNEGRALEDCLRLARTMTIKCLLAGLPAGGAKLVVLDHPELDHAAAYRFLGQAIERLGGRYMSGPDLGTGERELGWLAAQTRFATHPGEEGPGQLSEATAGGVLAGIQTALMHLDGEADWPRRSVLVQGLGAVGRLLARRLREKGARVLATDFKPERAAQVARELDLELLEPGAEWGVPCDVFSPNGLGGGLHDVSLPRLRTRIVAGGANNVLASEEHGDRLHQSGVLYVPDFVINSGALVRGALFQLEQRREPLARIEARIAETTRELLEQAKQQKAPPLRVALGKAQRLLEQRRALVDSRGLLPRPKNPATQAHPLDATRAAPELGS